MKTRGSSPRGEPLGEQDLVDARLQAETDLDPPDQGNEGNYEGAYARDPTHPPICPLILQQPGRHTGQQEPHRGDGVHRHRTWQDASEVCNSERPTDENHAADEYGHDARRPRECFQGGNKPRNGVTPQPGSSRRFISLPGYLVHALPAVPCNNRVAGKSSSKPRSTTTGCYCTLVSGYSCRATGNRCQASVHSCESRNPLRQALHASNHIRSTGLHRVPSVQSVGYRSQS